jgi:hypothetical protein
MMAKVKNTSNQPRGFFTEEGGHVTVPPGGEAEFNMTEADFKHAEELAQMEDPPLYEISGEPGGMKKMNAKEKREAELQKAEEDAQKAREKAEEREQKAAEQKEASRRRG